MLGGNPSDAPVPNCAGTPAGAPHGVTRRFAHWCRSVPPLLPLLATPVAVAVAADPQPYTVTIGKTGDGTVDAALKSSSNLVTLRTTAPELSRTVIRTGPLKPWGRT